MTARPAPPVPSEADEGQPTYIDNPIVDRMMDVLIEMGAEIWVNRERMAVIERLLAERGVLTAEDIEQFRPDAEMKARLKRENGAFIRRVYRALTLIGQPSPPPSLRDTP